MYKDVNRVTVCKENYKTQEEFENAVKNIIMFLINEDYVLTIKYDAKEFGIVVIEYDYANEEFGGALPYWLMPDEVEILEATKE